MSATAAKNNTQATTIQQATIIESEIVQERLAALKALKKRKRGAFQSKLSNYSAVIFYLKDECNASFQDIQLYLSRYHRLKTTRQNICHFYNKIVSESERINKSFHCDDYWGEAGELS